MIFTFNFLGMVVPSAIDWNQINHVNQHKELHIIKEQPCLLCVVVSPVVVTTVQGTKGLAARHVLHKREFCVGYQKNH